MQEFFSTTKLKRIIGNVVDRLVFTKPFAWIARIGLEIRSRQAGKIYRDMGIYTDKNGWPVDDPTDGEEAMPRSY